jgi:guanine nucleotide-binding protein subunit alpha, other
MRTFHGLPFSPEEVECYRQQIFGNLTQGLKYVIDALPDMGLALSSDNKSNVGMVTKVRDIQESEPFPVSYLTPLRKLWQDPAVMEAWKRRNEVALPEKYVGSLSRHDDLSLFSIPCSLPYFFSDLNRFFDPTYKPSMQDILLCRQKTTGITETSFKIGTREMLVVDVGGQKSERRKWIHCFQDVSCILFLVNLAGYDQCLMEDRDEVSGCLRFLSSKLFLWI